MKLLSSAFFTSALIISGFAHAADKPATLAITGHATNTEAVCAVNINPQSISLTSEADNLVIQGSKTIPQKSVSISLSGNDECYALQMTDHISYRFLGTADSVDGTVLANTDTSPEAATGVGVGLFTQKGDIINLNSIIHVSDTMNIGLEMVSLKRAEVTAGNVSTTLTVQVERL